MHNADFLERVKAVERVTRLFMIERIIYVIVIVISLVILLGCVVWALIKDDMGLAEVTAMFSSSGTIAYTTGRLIHMWNRAMNLLETNSDN